MWYGVISKNKFKRKSINMGNNINIPMDERYDYCDDEVSLSIVITHQHPDGVYKNSDLSICVNGKCEKFTSNKHVKEFKINDKIVKRSSSPFKTINNLLEVLNG
jgi:hypothetical protein